MGHLTVWFGTKSRRVEDGVAEATPEISDLLRFLGGMPIEDTVGVLYPSVQTHG